MSKTLVRPLAQGRHFVLGASHLGISHRTWSSVWPPSLLLSLQASLSPGSVPTSLPGTNLGPQGPGLQTKPVCPGKAGSSHTPQRPLAAPCGEHAGGPPGTPESPLQLLHKSEGGRPCFRPPLATLTLGSCILVSIKPRVSLKVFLKTKIGTFS